MRVYCFFTSVRYAMLMRNLAALAIAAFALSACGQSLYPQTAPPPGDVASESTALSAPNTVPTFLSSFTFQGTTFPFRMVGANPATHTSTTISTAIVPLILKFSDGTTLDSTAIANSIAVSPLFRATQIQSQTTQYGDAVMRGEFWQFAKTTSYHVLLQNPPHVFPAQTIVVPAADSVIARQSDGTKVRALNFSWFIHNQPTQPTAIIPLEIAKLHIPATTFTIFATRDVKVLEQGGFCCFGGYHDEFVNPPNTTAGTYTAAWGAIFATNVKDMTHVGHEVAEWMNDPFYLANYTHVPRWKHPRTLVCDSNQLEVGDPVADRIFTLPNGYSFEDAAFLEWFAHQSAATTVNARYDLLGQLAVPAVSC